MKSGKHTTLKVIAVLLVLALLGGAGWYWYDNNIDRSGWSNRNGVFYYRDFHAKPVTGWQLIDDQQYYFGEDNAMVTGWQIIDGQRYYFREWGVLASGWEKIGNDLYYLNKNGNPISGWQGIENSRFYFFPEGNAAIGWAELDGQHYFFDEAGAMQTGWLQLGEGDYYLADDGHMLTGLADLPDGVYFFQDNGLMFHGWIDLEKGRYYFRDDGTMYTGWLEMNDKKFFFSDDGIMQTGWLQQDEYRYYLQEDGSAATSPTEIDGELCFFTPKGIYVLLVNYKYAVPENYDADLVSFGPWARVSKIAESHLQEMIDGCKASGVNCWLNCGFRSYKEQVQILDERIEEYMENDSLTYADAREKALLTVAVPGYSEHQIGLAMDVVCSAQTDWLIENCWDYGFILRYPEDKKDITNIEYEFWHFRYVGTEVSLDMKDSGLCLEEYLGAA